MSQDPVGPHRGPFPAAERSETVNVRTCGQDPARIVVTSRARRDSRLMESQRIVVGVSQSLAGLAALRHAVALAGERGAVLHAVRAWRFMPTWRDGNAEFWSRVHAIEAQMLIPIAFEAAMGELPRCPLIVVPPPSLAQAQPVDELVRELGRDLAR
jgi:hypothetical protein